jgi:hypothetical protein
MGFEDTFFVVADPDDKTKFEFGKLIDFNKNNK